MSRAIIAVLRLTTLVLLLQCIVCQAQDDVCACAFQPEDPPECRVYGQLGDDVLIPWYRASQECLDVFQIKDQAIDPVILDSIYGSDPPNVNALVSFLRFNEGSTVANGIKLSMDEYFVEESDTGRVIFKAQIMDANGNTVNCRDDGVGDCWNVVKDYLNTPEGQQEMTEIGVTLYNQQAVSLEKEQSLVRIRLCSDGATTECEPLSGQVQDKVQELAGTKDCSAYGLGPRTDNLPYCGSSSSSSTTTTAEGTTDGNNISSSTQAEPKSSAWSIIGAGSTSLFRVRFSGWILAAVLIGL
ncbi:expressed unknown protein [Seminavis robusta]|uniref:Uncharacterized protein n=1 Tax=Seminavis robusta TaxID=568900 RepID=A0A9N8DID0_9STRA|nr:expressed unknown protein [Seminavis robusta]|eukprot:Sro137_g064340.1 n/a (299) ;mRNA; r:33164-34060